jgi:hypothetical protein
LRLRRVAVVFSALKLTPLPTPLLLLPLLLTALPPTPVPQLPYEFSIIFLSNFTHLFLLFYLHRQEMIGCDYGGGVLLLAWFGWVAELFAAGWGLP